MKYPKTLELEVLLIELPADLNPFDCMLKSCSSILVAKRQRRHHFDIRAIFHHTQGIFVRQVSQHENHGLFHQADLLAIHGARLVQHCHQPQGGPVTVIHTWGNHRENGLHVICRECHDIPLQRHLQVGTVDFFFHFFSAGVTGLKNIMWDAGKEVHFWWLGAPSNGLGTSWPVWPIQCPLDLIVFSSPVGLTPLSKTTVFGQISLTSPGLGLCLQTTDRSLHHAPTGRRPSIVGQNLKVRAGHRGHRKAQRHGGTRSDTKAFCTASTWNCWAQTAMKCNWEGGRSATQLSTGSVVTAALSNGQWRLGLGPVSNFGPGQKLGRKNTLGPLEAREARDWGSALELLLFLQTASLKSLFVREFAPKQGTIATFKESRHGHHSYAELDVSVLHRGGALGSWPSRDRIHKNCIVKVCEVHTEIFVLASQQLLQYGFPSPDHSRK